MKRTIGISIAAVLVAGMHILEAGAGVRTVRHNYSAYQILTGRWVGFTTVDESPVLTLRCYDEHIDHHYIVGVWLDPVNPETGDPLPTPTSPGEALTSLIAPPVMSMVHGIPMPTFDDFSFTKDGVTHRFSISLPWTSPQDGMIWKWGEGSYVTCACWASSYASDDYYSGYSWSSESTNYGMYFCQASDYMGCECWKRSYWKPDYENNEEWDRKFDRATNSTAETRAHFGN